MRANEVMGLIFANAHDNLMVELTERRSMASIPFGGRYRVIDFAMSNMVNAGISKVSVITKSNYHSLMDHLGAGKPWDLDRKKGGLFVLPPYSNGLDIPGGTVNAVIGIMPFLRHCNEEYVVMCDSDVIANIDIEKLVDAHIEKGADVTIAYKNGPIPQNHRDLMVLDLDEDEKVTDITFREKSTHPYNYSLDIVVVKRDILIDLVNTAASHNYLSISIDVFSRHLSDLNIYGYKIDEYAVIMDSLATYFNANMELLDKSVRDQLFNKERPIYTKTRDDMPAKYGLGSKVSNSVIADGCIIEGTVENCILFRGVRIGKDAVVKNCILMQDTVIEDRVNLTYITTDKNVVITKGKCLNGSENYPMTIRKDSVV